MRGGQRLTRAPSSGTTHGRDRRERAYHGRYEDRVLASADGWGRPALRLFLRSRTWYGRTAVLRIRSEGEALIIGEGNADWSSFTS